MLLVVLALVLVLVVFPVIAIWWYAHMIDENIAMRNAEAEAALSGPEPNSDGAFYALLMGSDRRSNKESGRSDSIMARSASPEACAGRCHLYSARHDGQHRRWCQQDQRRILI